MFNVEFQVPRYVHSTFNIPRILVGTPRMRTLLAHPWLTIRVQIALGVIFIAAALPKIVDPPSFAHMIYNYKLVPAALNNLMALVMPWIELLCGVALVL